MSTEKILHNLSQQVGGIAESVVLSEIKVVSYFRWGTLDSSKQISNLTDYIQKKFFTFG